LPTEIVIDPDPEGPRSSWRTYRQALETTPGWASHRLIIQDDAQPCKRFSELFPGRVAERPDRLLILCVCQEPREGADRVRRAAAIGRRWVTLYGPHIPTVATVWPIGLIKSFLAWVDLDQQEWGDQIYATNDDWVVGAFVDDPGEIVGALACVPSLVQHPDTEPSLLGRSAGRTAAVF
jgi:hypothetical protein